MTWPEMLLFLVLSAVGASLWRWGVRARQTRLLPEETSPHGVGLFVLGWLLLEISVAVAFARVPPEQVDAVPLADRMLVQALANVVAVGVVLLIALRLRGGVAALGVRQHEGSRAPLTALAAWLTFLPALAAVTIANQGILDVFGVEEPVQDHLARFLDEPASVLAWISMVVIIPPCEELLFRGALHGGLRRHIPPRAAIVLSGLLFGIMHDPVALLPVSALGMLLAWLYERTGSLAAPCLAHSLHNGVILVLASTLPETMT